MRATTLLNQLLNLPGTVGVDPGSWQVGSGGGEVGIRLRLVRRLLACPHCEFRSRHRYDTREADSSWRHLDRGGRVCQVSVRRRRLRCPQHGVVVEGVPFARPGSGFTRDFEQMVAWLVTKTDKKTSGELMRVAWRTVGAIAQRVAADELDPERLSGLVEIGVDEISWKKHHHSLTLVSNHDTGKIVWGKAGKDAETLNAFFDEVGEEATETIEAVSMGLGPAFAKSVRTRAPRAVICFDPFYADVEAVVPGRDVVGGPEVGIIRDRVGFRLFSPCSLLERSTVVHSVPDPSRVRFGGPLAPFAPGLVVELASLGYTRTSVTLRMRLAASLSRWLDAVGVSVDELTGPVMERFLSERRARGASHYSPRALVPIMDYLRRVGVVSAVVASAPPVSVVEVLLERFARYLATRRALTPVVVRAYVRWVGPFTEDVLCPAGVDRLGVVSAGEVAAFLAARLPVMSGKSARMTACALRSLLRFPHAEALIDAALIDAVPSVASWRLSGLPQALTSSQVQALRHACEGSDPVDRRDLAVIILMRRWGLRCAEVAALRLEDIDWPGGTVTIHGTGNRIEWMPLPVDAGQALVDYPLGGRGRHERSHGVRPREGTGHAVAFLERQVHRGPGRSRGGTGNRARAPVAPCSGDRDIERRCESGRGRPVDAPAPGWPPRSSTPRPTRTAWPGWPAPGPHRRVRDDPGLAAGTGGRLSAGAPGVGLQIGVHRAVAGRLRRLPPGPRRAGGHRRARSRLRHRTTRCLPAVAGTSALSHPVFRPVGSPAGPDRAGAPSPTVTGPTDPRRALHLHRRPDRGAAGRGRPVASGDLGGHLPHADRVDGCHRHPHRRGSRPGRHRPGPAGRHVTGHWQVRQDPPAAPAPQRPGRAERVSRTTRPAPSRGQRFRFVGHPARHPTAPATGAPGLSCPDRPGRPDPGIHPLPTPLA